MKAIRVGIHSRRNDKTALQTHFEIIKATTRLWVTNSWYLRNRQTAMNPSKLNKVTPKKDEKPNKFTVKAQNLKIMLQAGLFSVFCSISMTRVAMYEGCTIKPTPRSETARLKSSVLKGLGNDESFVKAQIVKQFSITAVQDKKAFKTQVVIYDEVMSSWFSMTVDGKERRRKGKVSRSPNSTHSFVL